MKSGAQLHFLLSGKAVTSFAEPSAGVGGRGSTSLLSPSTNSGFGAFLSITGTLPKRKHPLPCIPCSPAPGLPPQQHPRFFQMDCPELWGNSPEISVNVQPKKQKALTVQNCSHFTSGLSSAAPPASAALEEEHLTLPRPSVLQGSEEQTGYLQEPNSGSPGTGKSPISHL